MAWCFRLAIFIVLSYGVDTEKHRNRPTTVYQISFIGKEFGLSIDCKPGPWDWTASGDLDINNNIRHENALIATGGLHKDAFHICLPKFGGETFCHDVKVTLDPDKWVNLLFSQTKSGDTYYFKIHMDGKMLFRVENQEPHEFRNVLIDMGTPVNLPDPAFYKNFHVAFECSKVLSSKTMQLSRNRLLNVIRKINKEYRISFSFKLKKHYRNMGNVITLLAPNIRNKHAVGTPVVFNVPGKNQFYICSENPIKLSRCFSTPKNYPLKNWIHVEISQVKYGERYIHKIFVNGDELYTRENKFPQEFEHVKVYAGSPHHPSVTGVIKNLAINEHCQMNPVIRRVNLPGFAPSLGTWGNWKPHSPCSATCGGGVKKRYRLCENTEAGKKDAPSVCLLSKKKNRKGAKSFFEMETTSCNVNKCPVHGKWSAWAAYTTCSNPCGGGKQTRTRTCANPAPSNGGRQCLSASGKRKLKESVSRICNPKPCPVHGGWGSWTLSCPCTKSCGGGTLTKARVCERPIPSGGGRKCRNKDGKLVMGEIIMKKCNTRPCKDDSGIPKGVPKGNWKLVRHVPPRKQWHRSTDHLVGTDVYGTPCGPTCKNEWSVKFNHLNFNRFLFATGDKSKWLVAEKDAVIGGNYANQPRRILKSSTSSKSYKAKWYRRSGVKEDPWISLTDHSNAIGEGNIIYGENKYGGAHAANILPKHGGANVFIDIQGAEHNCKKEPAMVHFPAIRANSKGATSLGTTGPSLGYMNTISYSQVPGKEMQGGVLSLKNGKSLSYNQWFEGFVFVLDGSFSINDNSVNGQTQTGAPGDSFYIPRGTKITYRATGDSKLYYVAQPPGAEFAEQIQAAKASRPKIQKKANHKGMTIPLFKNKYNSKSYLEDTIFSNIKGREFTGGFYELLDGPALPYTYDYEEFKYIVEGEFHLQDGTGQKVVAKAGDLMYFPIGTAVKFTSPNRGLGFYVGQRKGGEAK